MKDCSGNGKEEAEPAWNAYRFMNCLEFKAVLLPRE